MKKYIIVLSALMALFAPAVRAVPYVTGDITFVGGAILNGPLGSATQINAFTAPPTVISVDGDLDLFVNSGDPALFTVPFKFGVSTPYPTLYSVGGWNFELFSSSINTQNANFLAIEGVVEITGNGYLPTPGIFRFSSQSPSAGGAYSFSASTQSARVPDGGSILLLSSMPLLGIAILRKKFEGKK